MLDVNMFDQLKIGLATADQIRIWSHGEVKKPETINYRTLRPEKDGLFCEKIFGPTRDWECYCGKYKRVRFKGIICERCGVEVTRSKVRRDRMGHIQLEAPVVHIWYLRGTRSWLAYLLAGIEPKEELKAKQLEKVIYFAANLVTWVDEDKRHDDLPNLENEYLEERDAIQKELELAIDRRYKELEDEAEARRGRGRRHQEAAPRRREGHRGAPRALRDRARPRGPHVGRVQGPPLAQDPRRRDAVARAARQVRRLLRGRHRRRRDQAADRPDRLRRGGDQAPRGHRPGRVRPQAAVSAQRKQKAIKRLKIVASFNRRDEHGRRINDPKAMILDVVPVIPPELRPMVQLDGGRFATSDLNDLYRRVINRNNRLGRLLGLGRAGDHRQQREADAAGGRRRAVRQRPPRPPGHRARATAR